MGASVNETERAWQNVLERLRGTERSIAIVVTGGGAGVLGHCFRREGASQNFMDAAIPYSRAALKHYLGEPPCDASVSPAVAKQLARAAWNRARQLQDKKVEPDSESDDAAVGIAMTAALPTTPPRGEDHRIHVALHTSTRGVCWSVVLSGDQWTRPAAESITDAIVLTALADLVDSAGVPDWKDDQQIRIDRVEYSI